MTSKPSTIRVLDPIADPPSASIANAPRLDTLRGRRLGIRVDDTWPSFQIFADVLAETASTRWRTAAVLQLDPGSRRGDPREETDVLAPFARSVDAVVVGLGT